MSKTKRRFKATTDSKHHLPVAPNLLNRDFHPARPNEVYVGDITCVWTAEGWFYPALVMDLFSRAVVGWAMDKCMTRQLVINSLTTAVQRRAAPSWIVFHSDQGSQYASADFQSLLRQYGMHCSMSRKGDYWDKAPG